MPDPILTQIGPAEEEVQKAKIALTNLSAFSNFFKGDRIRILDFRPIYEYNKDTVETDTLDYYCTLYDYTKDKSYELIWSCQTKHFNITELEQMANPNLEEIEEAKALLISALKIKDKVDKDVLITNAMPPAIKNEKGQRCLNFWIHDKSLALKNGIYSVNLSNSNHQVENINYKYQFDFNSESCGPEGKGPTFPWPTQPLQVIIPDPWGGLTPLWSFLIIPSCVSSGVKGSGVELKDVYYRGILMLKNAHTPKLNVKYQSVFQFNDEIKRPTIYKVNNILQSAPPLPLGYVRCSTPPITIYDDGLDDGNFTGVTLYKNTLNNTFQVSSEIECGHYRYVSEWIFYPDGTIKPNFKFGAVSQPLTCNPHTHHVYWRFDFDVNGQNNNIVSEYYSSTMNGNTVNWISNPAFTSEVTRFRIYPFMKWSIKGNGNRQCDLIAGSNDGNGTSDTWAGGDVFVAKYNSNQINEWGGSGETDFFKTSNLINSENLLGENIVIWYRAGSLHDENSPNHADQHLIVGPTIKCNWPHPKYKPMPSEIPGDKHD